MNKYEIVETVMLGFLTPQDQYDSFIDPGKGFFLEREEDGDTIFLIRPDGERCETITQAHAIETWLEDGKIRSLPDVKCKTISSEFVAPGWGCCECHTYNGLQRHKCKFCGHLPCYTEIIVEDLTDED